MIDFWALLAKAAMDDDFRTSIAGPFLGKTPAADPCGNPYSCLFDSDDYNRLRDLVTGQVAPVSLMALGEWLALVMLRPKALDSLKQLGEDVRGDLAGYASADPAFDQALGAMFVDVTFRADFRAGNEGRYGFRLSPDDRAALERVMADPNFDGDANQFHQDGWDRTCKDMAAQWLEHQYCHALEAKLSDLTSVLLEARGAVASSTAAPDAPSVPIA